MKIVAVLILCIGLVFYSCSADPKGKADDKGNKEDTLAMTKAEDVSSGQFAPPDSTYTGDYFEKYPSGVIKVRGTFRFGKKSGKWMYFFPNGTMWSEAFFHNDKMNGGSNVYHSNGQLMYSGHYKMDVADSVWNFYDSLGKLVETRDYNKIKSDKK